MNALELRGVTRTLGDFKLGPLDLTLPQGCILGLIGKNGAGKSTTIRLILEMLRPEAGTIRVLGSDDLTGIRAELGVVPDTVGLPLCLTAKEAGKVMAGIYQNWDANLYDSLLRRLEVPRDKKFKDLSKGMRMKLGIALAMSHDARLLILDEATAGLDPVVRDQVLDLLMEFTRQEDRSVLLSSHIVSDLEKVCDYIAFLDKGQLLLFEEKDALREQYAVARVPREQLSRLAPEQIVGKRESPYGAEVLLRRDHAPDGWDLYPVTIEELFVYMVREVEV